MINLVNQINILTYFTMLALLPKKHRVVLGEPIIFYST
jgi:hypothetical protein